MVLTDGQAECAQKTVHQNTHLPRFRQKIRIFFSYLLGFFHIFRSFSSLITCFSHKNLIISYLMELSSSVT
jgi:hypothetical protein